MTEIFSCNSKSRAGYVPIDAHLQILDNTSNAQEKEVNNDLVITIYGYERSISRLILFHCINILLLGIPYLLFKWFPNWAYIFRRFSCSMLKLYNYNLF